MKKINIQEANIFKKINNSITAGEEISIGSSTIKQLLMVDAYSGNIALYVIGTQVGQVAALTQNTLIFGTSSSGSQQLLLYRKSAGGLIFIKNNSVNNRTVSVTFITT